MSNNIYPSATANKAINCLKWGEGEYKTNGLSYDFTKYEAVHPTVVSEKLLLIRNAHNFDKKPNSMYQK